MKYESWKQIARKLIEDGWHYEGMCACTNRARKYGKGMMKIKVFPYIASVKLYLRNKTITGYEPFEKIETLIALAHEAEVAERAQWKNSSRI